MLGATASLRWNTTKRDSSSGASWLPAVPLASLSSQSLKWSCVTAKDSHLNGVAGGRLSHASQPPHLHYRGSSPRSTTPESREEDLAMPVNLPTSPAGGPPHYSTPDDGFRAELTARSGARWGALPLACGAAQHGRSLAEGCVPPPGQATRPSELR